MLRTALIVLLALLLSATTASAEDAQPTALPVPPGSETEPNGTAGTATPIAAGERIRAVRTGGDVDHYRFTAEQGDRVFAAVVTAGDSRLAVLGPDGATVIESDDNGGTLGPQSSSIAGATIPATGAYYLKVDGPQHDSQLVPYDVVLDVQSGDPAPEAEPTDPQMLGGERYVSGTRAAGDSDRFGLELEAGDTVFLSLDLDPERDGTRIDGRLAFGQEDLIDSDDHYTGDANPSEAYAGTVDSAGVHLVSVDAAAADQSGTYVLSITVIPAVQRSCRTYTISPAAGEIPDRGTATFPIDVTDAATIDHAALRLDVTHSFMRDLDATLEAPGNRIGLFDDIGGDRIGGPHTRMLTLFDDNAATQPVYEPMKGRGLQPEPAGSLGLLAGQQAAGTWNLFLRDDAVSDVGSLVRADLILCARPEEGPVETVFSAGFESGDDGFTHSGAGDEWERGTPATPASGSLAVLDHCAEGTGCFKTDLDGTYEPNSSQELVSPPISLEGRSGSIYVSWEMWYQLESAHFDHLAVSVEEAGSARATVVHVGRRRHVGEPRRPADRARPVRRLGTPPCGCLGVRGQDDPAALPPGLRPQRPVAWSGDRRRSRLPAARRAAGAGSRGAARRNGAGPSERRACDLGPRARATAVPRQVMLDLRLRPGLYRLTVRVQLDDGRLSSSQRRFLRVVG
jgi:subtilisin-like proprotein convertase family protein